jgi:hypothetical protein
LVDGATKIGSKQPAGISLAAAGSLLRQVRTQIALMFRLMRGRVVALLAVSIHAASVTALALQWFALLSAEPGQ